MEKNIHFIGIGGIGVSALAQIMHEKGHKISGSDSTPSQITKNLKLKGIKIFYKHNKKNITKEHNLVVFSPAIPKDNPELLEAKKRKIRCINYPEALGELTKNHFTIAVSGTHGKSTTTAMLASIMLKAKLDPTIVIGTKMRELKNKNYRTGKSKYLILEACEYKESFLHFNPDILIITNIEADHLDYYKNLSNYKKAFEKLIKKVPKNGTIVINPKDKNSISLTKNIAQKTVKSSKTFIPGIPGKFNIENASIAAKTAEILEIPEKTIKKTLQNYKGSWRRMEYKKTKIKKLIFIDDYAHHPTEIKLTLKALREKYKKRHTLCVFQPHQYNRTKALLKEFGKSFKDANRIIVPNIYKVRDSEKDIKSISTDDLVKEIKKNKTTAINGNGIKETAEYIKANQKNLDIVITMGAGDIDKIYRYL
jgi:UDP-N-acetylmuramate--alanine ligase